MWDGPPAWQPTLSSAAAWHRTTRAARTGCALLRRAGSGLNRAALLACEQDAMAADIVRWERAGSGGLLQGAEFGAKFSQIRTLRSGTGWSGIGGLNLDDR